MSISPDTRNRKTCVNSRTLTCVKKITFQEFKFKKGEAPEKGEAKTYTVGKDAKIQLAKGFKKDAEASALRRACESPRPVVVSVAGGALLREENRVLVRASGRVVWLRARVETLALRVGDGTGRPLLDDDPDAALRLLDAVRRPLYAEVADDVIDVDDLSPDAVVTRIVGLGPAVRVEGGPRPDEPESAADA